MGLGRVIEAHCEIKRDAGPTQMTAPSGASGTLQFTRTSAEHVEAGQSADKHPYVVYSSAYLIKRIMLRLHKSPQAATRSPTVSG
ncbi:membrane-bound lytic murein transglycosylase MltF [Pseudarthrobacter sp. PvP004]|nr:membrane-bound lytic murein transglycosylase MltF [Pseudarthrobacter sp. PvP004]